MNNQPMKTNNEAKHTPGPWSFTKRDGDEWWFGGDDGAEIVIHASGAKSYENFAVLGSRFSTNMNEANARLIAAAPELLEALNKLLFVTERQVDTKRTMVGQAAIRIARAAIAKATGQA